MKTIERGTRSRLLCGVGAAALAMFSTSAMADPASTVVTDPVSPVPVTVGHLTATSMQLLTDDADAQVAGVEVGVDGITSGGVQVGEVNDVSANTLRANGVGNTYTSQIDLSLIKSTESDPDPLAHGAAALSLQLTGANTVSSQATGNTIGIDRPGFESGSAAATSNTIQADALANEARQSVAGVIPSDYTSDAQGVSALDYPDVDVFAAEGTVVVSTLQQAQDTGVAATAAGNTVSLSLTADGANSVASAPAVDDNTIAASARVNSARNTIDLRSGDSPSFEGSAVVSNVQSNNGLVSQTATNAGSTIGASVYGEDTIDGDVNTLVGSLSLSGNTVSSTMSGNEATGAEPGVAGNRILIDGVSVAGPAAPNSATATIAYDAGALTQTAEADFVISSSQSNVGDGDPLSLAATTAGATVLGQVQSLDGGSIDVEGNTAAATVNGNVASSAIASSGGAADFTASVAVANQQVNNNVDQSADLLGIVIAAVTGTDDGVTHDSAVSVTGNASSARGYGASAVQSVSLEANTVGIGAGPIMLTGGTGPDGNVTALGGAVIANLQSSYDSSLDVVQAASDIGVDADSRGLDVGGTTISGSTLSTTANTQEAVAVANSGANSLSLAGTVVGSGAGVASVQILDDDSSVSATMATSRVGVVAGTHVTDSQLETSGNLQRAIAYGGSASNAVTVEANSLTLGAPVVMGSTIQYDSLNDQSFSDSSLPLANAAFGLLNDQSSQADIAAAAVDSTVGVWVEGDVDASSVDNVANSYVAAAYGNDATNAATMALGNLEAASAASIAAVANTQAAGEASSTISATASGGNVVLTAIEDDVTDSGVATSDNTVQALAVGNRSGSTLSVSGNNIEAPAGVATVVAVPGIDSVLLTASGAFTAQNAQAAHGAISASQLDDPLAPATSASVLTTIGDADAGTGDVSNATVVSEGNRLLASVTGNSGRTGVAVEANQLAMSTGVQNFQATDAGLSALIGLPGSEGFEAFTVPATITEGVAEGNISHLSLDERAAFVATYSGQPGWTYDAGTGDFSYTTAGDGGVSLPVGAEAATPNSGGVTIAVNGAISGSQLSVDGNVVAGSVTGNSAANSLEVAATDIASATSTPTTLVNAIGDTSNATGDHALSNVQRVESGSLNSAVYSSFALDTVDGAGIDNSTLSVSGNSQSASAVGNTAGSTLALDANAITAGSGLVSVQSVSADVTALSDMEVSAPTASEGSSVSLSDNANRSLAVMNDATNTASVSATLIEPSTPAGSAALATGGLGASANGNHVAVNQQLASGSVDSTAYTSLRNGELPADADLGVSNGSVTVAGNSTSAEATANQASSSLALNGLSTQSANAGLVNWQASSADVQADAISETVVALTGDALPALSNSSVSVGGNATTSLARGNAASNVLNVAAGSGYGPALNETAGSTLFPLGGSLVNARAAAANEQVNTGSVSAQSANVTYAVALNADAAPALSASSVSVSNNRVGAEAYGNSANNRVTVAALNTGTPTAAVANNQTNSGAITAQAVTVTIGAFGNGSAASTLRTAGNQVTATAVGNSAVSTLTAAR